MYRFPSNDAARVLADPAVPAALANLMHFKYQHVQVSRHDPCSASEVKKDTFSAVVSAVFQADSVLISDTQMQAILADPDVNDALDKTMNFQYKYVQLKRQLNREKAEIDKQDIWAVAIEAILRAHSAHLPVVRATLLPTGAPVPDAASINLVVDDAFWGILEQEWQADSALPGPIQGDVFDCIP